MSANEADPTEDPVVAQMRQEERDKQKSFFARHNIDKMKFISGTFLVLTIIVVLIMFFGFPKQTMRFFKAYISFFEANPALGLVIFLAIWIVAIALMFPGIVLTLFCVFVLG